jgi:membrane-associated protease RseP (regulator of RpoE activity)
MKCLYRVLIAAFFATVAMSSVTLAAPKGDNDQGSNNNNRNDQSRAPQSDATNQRAFLGVAVSALDDSLRSHLQNQVSDGSGVLVEDVAEDSPAAKAGIEQHDILVTLDDQRLYSPEQLVRLVESDKPGRQVKLHIVRNGKSQDIEATLGSHQMHGRHSHRAYSWPTTSQSRDRRDENGRDQNGSDTQQNQQENQWRSFDAMSLARVDRNKFKAEIRYRDDRGNIESHHFQGTPDELRHDIKDQKDLPRAERDRLLQALNVATTSGGDELQEYDLSTQRN